VFRGRCRGDGSWHSCCCCCECWAAAGAVAIEGVGCGFDWGEEVGVGAVGVGVDIGAVDIGAVGTVARVAVVAGCRNTEAEAEEHIVAGTAFDSDLDSDSDSAAGCTDCGRIDYCSFWINSLQYCAELC